MTELPPPYGGAPGPAYPPPSGAQYPSPYPPAYPPAYPPQYLPAAARPGVDGFAITALVLSILGGVIFAVAFAIPALRRIGRGERRGKPLAIVALCVSAAWVVALVGVFAFQAGRNPGRDSAGVVTHAGQVAPAELQIGDCVELPRITGTVRTVPVRPCSQLHNGEVFTTVTATDTSFPGQDALVTEGLNQCKTEARTFLNGKDSLLHVVAFVPTSTRWDLGDRKESCLLVDREKDITGQIRDDA